MHNMHKMHNIHRTLHNRFGLLLLGVVSMAGCATPDHTTEGAVGGGLLGGGLGALIGSASGHAGAGAAIGAGIGAWPAPPREAAPMRSTPTIRRWPPPCAPSEP